MEQYINKAAIVAEIKNLENTYKKCPTRNSYEEGLKDGRLIGYKDALYKINTFEVKEVDLEKEIKEEYLEYRCYGGRDNMLVILNEPQFNKIAKHFYEFGIKASKGE